MRTWQAVFVAALTFVVLALPGASWAGVAPTLSAPDTGASGFVEGKSMAFEWNGSLQGDTTERSRSFFRLEAMLASKVPAGTQTAWDDSDASYFSFQTEPGDDTTSASLGVPAAGTYKWRVCAWGVVDHNVAMEVEQLPSGCSSARSFTTAAPVTNDVAPGTTTINHTSTTQEADTHKDLVRTIPADPIAPEHKTITREAKTVIDVKTVTKHDGTKPAKKRSAVGLDTGPGLEADAAASRDQGTVKGIVTTGLNSTLPLIPVPFWTLVLLLACIPIARSWRKNVIAMFDWPDDGDLPVLSQGGRYSSTLGDLATVPVAHAFKNQTTPTDTDASAPTQSAPDWGRNAA